jgi:hypothetical protein
MQYPKSFNEGGIPEEALGAMGMDEELAQGMSQISGAFRAEVAAQVAAMDKQDPEALEQLLELVGYINQSPDKYPQILRSLIEQDIIDEGDFPAEMDQAHFTILEAVLKEALAKETQEYAQGGLAALAKKGRNGDTQLAHITKDEAKLLRAMGGAGTINPETGLPEFFLKKIVKAVKGVVKGVGKVVGGIMDGLGPIGDLAAIIPSPIQPFAQAGKAISAANKGDWLTAITAGVPAVSGLNSSLNLGIDASTLSGIRTAGNVLGAGAALQSGDILAALSRAIQIPEIASILPGEIGGIPTKTILQGAGAVSQATRGNYFNAIFGAMEAAGLQKIPGTDISLNDAKKAVGILGPAGGGIADTPAAQAASAMNPAGLAALFGASAVAQSIGQKAQAEQAEQERQRAFEESMKQSPGLFSTSAFAGGGMVKRFSNGGFSDEDLRFFDNSDRVFASLPIVSGAGPGDRFGNLGIGSISSSDIRAATQPSQSQLQSIWNSLGSAAKALFMTDGKVDWTKLGSIAGGLYGYNQAKDFDMSGVGFQGTIPQLAAARAQVPYQYDAERRPGSYGRRYLSDMYYAKPEDMAKIQQQALEQARGIAALQRTDGTMSTAIAPGGITPFAPAPAPTTPTTPNSGVTPAVTSPTSRARLQEMYQNILGREGEQAGLDYWANRFGNEVDASEYAQFINEANKEIVGRYTQPMSIADLYQTYLGRAPDAGGAQYWQQQFGNEVDAGELQTFLNAAQKEQVLNAYGGYRPDMTVNDLYTNFLGRAPDAGGAQYWQQQFGPSIDQNELTTFLASAQNEWRLPRYAEGGEVREPRYLDGPTNGQSDKIQTTIDGEQPALLSHGEFVVPADVVGALGGGNSKAGASALYEMMDRVRQQAFGRKKQMDQIDPNKILPA